ncbi:MAG: dienelactone hydrolase family protein [Reyranella sp.]|uniref:dienelactone hydrolase family protein n=1 Tax=Reyranella sp. TaxID=1929291 RepID=UPI003D0B1430
MKPALAMVATAICLLAQPPARAEPVTSLADGRLGLIEFASATPSGPSALVRQTYPVPGTTVRGTLSLPQGAAGRVPAMVIAHGSGGILPGREAAWAARLGALGLATFVVDSFGPRNLQSTARDQTRLSTMANLADALAALRLLATHPQIDPARIGVMGFSRGGQVALYSTLEPLRRGMIDGALRFAAHVALYPSCSIPYHAASVTGSPILMLLGGADDYTPAAACHTYAAWFRDKGTPVDVTVYEGAYHDFDIPPPPRFVPELQSARGCKAQVEVESGTMQRLDSGGALRDPAAIAAYLRGCMERGATMGGDPRALALAARDVGDFLRRTFALREP